VAGSEALLPAGQAGKGSRFFMAPFLTSKLTLMSDKPTWGVVHVLEPWSASHPQFHKHAIELRH